MDADARLDAVEIENERLRGRIDQLEAALGLEFLPPVEWGLTGSEGRVFGVLLARSLATRDALMAALYHDLGRDEAEIKIVDVFVCKIRRKLKPFGLEIETVWGRGYALTAQTRAAVTALFEARGIAA